MGKDFSYMLVKELHPAEVNWLQREFNYCTEHVTHIIVNRTISSTGNRTLSSTLKFKLFNNLAKGPVQKSSLFKVFNAWLIAECIFYPVRKAGLDLLTIWTYLFDAGVLRWLLPRRVEGHGLRVLLEEWGRLTECPFVLGASRCVRAMHTCRLQTFDPIIVFSILKDSAVNGGEKVSIKQQSISMSTLLTFPASSRNGFIDILRKEYCLI